MMQENCPICEGRKLNIQGKYRGTSLLFTDIERVHCYECDMVFADPMPNISSLEQYNSNYFMAAHGGQAQFKSALAFFSGMARWRSNDLYEDLKKMNCSISKLLEIGPGPGFLAANWVKDFPQAQYFAIESDSSCHVHLKNLGIEVLPLGFSCPASMKFDLIVMSHVLEHISNPINFLQKAFDKLRDGGAIFIEVPCRDYLHKDLDEPHLLFFNKKSILYLLKKLGFTNIQITYHGLPIEDRGSVFGIRRAYMGVRGRLINMGIHLPFGFNRKGMDGLEKLERAVLAPYLAHCESQVPAWWLRVMAIKK